MKWFVAIAALLTAAPVIPETVGFQHNEAAIVQVHCRYAMGTAFKVGPTFYITALHVVEGGTCSVDGQLVTINTMDVENDFATFTGPPSDAILKVNCKGFRPGEEYIARGFAFGGRANFLQPLTATSARYRHNGHVLPFTVFVGDIFKGMSGGPTIDDKGRAVGVNSKLNPSMATPLSMTGLCK